LERKGLLTHNFQELWFLPALLYAETHYRFPGFFSLLKKNEPEVIADAPHRLEPGQKLPLLILAKDAHRYACRITEISVEIRQHNRIIRKLNLLSNPLHPEGKFFWRIFPIDVSDIAGWIEVDVTLTLERNGKSKTYHNDNHRTSSHRPLGIFVSKNALPRFPDLYLGDPHTHSHLTDDQVEFGVPLLPGRTLAHAMGLAYYCVTDHSYDLDDHHDSYLTNDPELVRWRALQTEIDHLNDESDDFVIVRGEEVSCRNKKGQNVHFLLFGQREFVRGSGDSAERWLQTRSEFNVVEVLEQRTDGAAAYAAHAKEPVPFLQRLLLSRGIWTDADLSLDGMTGFQIINGRLDKCFDNGYEAWKRLLLRGKRLYILAGDDAHGNFNRFRQIGIPFVSMREHNDQIFGRMRSGLFTSGKFGESNALRSLREGNVILTDGPVARMSVKSDTGASAAIGGSVRGNELELTSEILSTPEFGEISSVAVIVGKVGAKAEQTAFTFGGNQGFALHKQFALKQAAISYVRLEIWTSALNTFDHQRHFCLTNPIWFDPPP
jgi:hypothetical protein